MKNVRANKCLFAIHGILICSVYKKYSRQWCFWEKEKENHRNMFHIKINMNINYWSRSPFKVMKVNLNIIWFSMTEYTVESNHFTLLPVFSRRRWQGHCVPWKQRKVTKTKALWIRLHRLHYLFKHPSYLRGRDYQVSMV